MKEAMVNHMPRDSRGDLLAGGTMYDAFPAV